MRSVGYVVVTMNRCAEVVRCLPSLRAQTYPGTEITVVDNQSRDGASRVVAEQFPEARLLVSTENLGAAGGRNLGIEAARGDICVFIDDAAELRDADGTARLVS
jgi:GT2 family glycosyltransferase